MRLYAASEIYKPMNRKANDITHELVLTEYDKLTIVAQEETKKAVQYLKKLAKKKRKQDAKTEDHNK